jgi:hypothetical protein
MERRCAFELDSESASERSLATGMPERPVFTHSRFHTTMVTALFGCCLGYWSWRTDVGEE